MNSLKLFQKAVRKIIRLGKLYPQRKHKLFDTDVGIFNQNFLVFLKKLKAEEEELVARKSLGQKELDDMNFLLMKLDCHKIDWTFVGRFEMHKDFLLYLPHNNLGRVVEGQDRCESER